MNARALFFSLTTGLALAACAGPAAMPSPTTPPPVVAPPATGPNAEEDPLGPRPEVGMPPAFVPPAPGVFVGTHGIAVWLMERHEVPLVSCVVTVPSGASSDPKGKGGTASAAAKMLREGAGALGSIEMASAIDDLGASIGSNATADASFVSLTVLKKNLERAFTLFGDVVTKPRFAPADYKRVKDLWLDGLLAREKDPGATARVVYGKAFFGADHPYGHPVDGTRKTASAVSLDDVQAFYRAAWRPDRATLVCAGDVTKGDLAALMDVAFAKWKAPSTPAPPPLVPPAPAGPWPKVVLVDRPDAAQAAVAVVRPGVSGDDPSVPALDRVNDAIGGGFASRLNQDLREKRGFTYGASSGFQENRGVGFVLAIANVATDKTGPALAAMLDDLREFAASGLTSDEVTRTQSQVRSGEIGGYESVESIAGHLAVDASLGRSPEYAGKSVKAADAATKAELDALAKRYYAPEGVVVVVVGPLAKVRPMVEELGLGAVELRNAEGDVVKSAK